MKCTRSQTSHLLNLAVTFKMGKLFELYYEGVKNLNNAELLKLLPIMRASKHIYRYAKVSWKSLLKISRFGGRVKIS